MQVDPNPWRVPATLPCSGPWPRRGGRFALLPLAFALLPAGLLSACSAPGPSLIAATAATAQPAGRGASPMAASPASTRGLFPATLTHAEQGDVDAMLRLALMHETGTAEVAQDRAEMLRWLALASALGSGPASYRMFLHYDEQPGSRARANRFKELAQRQGYFGPVSAQGSR